MARGARRVLAVLFHALAHRQQPCRPARASVSSSAGTLGGGGGGGEPSSTSITHLPRCTGEVRSATEVSIRMLPWPSRPRRFRRAACTRRNSGAGDVRDAVVPREPLVDERVVGGQQVEHAAILADDAVEEQLGLALHRLGQRVVERADTAAQSGWILSRSCSRSHCEAKRVASASARGSASIRRTCFSSTAGARSVPLPRRLQQLLRRAPCPRGRTTAATRGRDR